MDKCSCSKGLLLAHVIALSQIALECTKSLNCNVTVSVSITVQWNT
jgi:hypothetical protein